MNFKEVNKILRLTDTSDWGIINADAKRVNEFIEFLDRNSTLDKSTKFEFVELIIASMNEAILQKLDTADVRSNFLEYIKRIESDNYYSSSIGYWKSLNSNEDFPVSKLL